MNASKRMTSKNPMIPFLRGDYNVERMLKRTVRDSWGYLISFLRKEEEGLGISLGAYQEKRTPLPNIRIKKLGGGFAMLEVLPYEPRLTFLERARSMWEGIASTWILKAKASEESF